MIETTPSAIEDIVISLCICTYNRAESLRRTLESVARQERCEGRMEILLIDNNSSDRTREIVEDFSKVIPLRYFFESAQGLSQARNRGLREFRGRYLLFTDDDVRLAANWVKCFEAATRANPDAEYFGGRILPDWLNNKPDWIGEAPLPLIDGLLGWFDLGANSRRFDVGDSGPNGASFAVSRRLTQMVGPFDVDLGCVGRARGRGEETDWIARAKVLDAKGVYVGEAVCWHRVEDASLTLSRLFVYGVHSGRANLVMRGGKSEHRLSHFVSFAIRGLWQLLRGRGGRFRQCVINMGIVFGARFTAPRIANDACLRRAPNGVEGE